MKRRDCAPRERLVQTKLSRGGRNPSEANKGLTRWVAPGGRLQLVVDCSWWSTAPGGRLFDGLEDAFANPIPEPAKELLLAHHPSSSHFPSCSHRIAQGGPLGESLEQVVR